MTVQRDVERIMKQQGGSGVDSFIERIADKLGSHAGVATVYGAPVERGSVTVIPVAKVRWGFGGGGGRGRGKEATDLGEGSGGGGGITTTPIGFIEIQGGRAEFRPIKEDPSPLAIVPLVIAGGLAAMMVLHSVRRLLRG